MRYWLLLIPLSILSSFTSCSKPSAPSQGKPLVIVSVSPYDTFVKSIAGDTVDVRVAVPANYNSHVFEPTPKHMQGFNKATLWFGIGEPFEKTLLNALLGYNKNLKTVDLSHNLSVDPSLESSITIGDCESHHGHHHEGRDLHFWMSPHLSSIQAATIAETLIAMFPQYSSLYQDNLKTLQERFHTLDIYLKKVLSPLQQHALVISHPSLGYFCRDYHLIQISIECEGKTPVPGDLNRILHLSKQHPVVCVFTQEQFDNKGALTIAKKLDLPVYSINPNNPDYFNNMNKIAQEITKAEPK